MAELQIQGPDSKLYTVDLPQGADPSAVVDQFGKDMGWTGQATSREPTVGDYANVGAAAVGKGVNEGLNALNTVSLLGRIGDFALKGIVPGFAAQQVQEKALGQKPTPTPLGAIADVAERNAKYTQPVNIFGQGAKDAINPELVAQKRGVPYTGALKSVGSAGEILGSFVNPTSLLGPLAQTAKFALASSALGGLGDYIGGDTGKVIGSLLPAAYPLAAAGVRGALRGAQSGEMNAALSDAALSGMPISAGQASGLGRTSAIESLTGKVTPNPGFAQRQLSGAENTVKNIAEDFAPIPTQYGAGESIIQGANAANQRLRNAADIQFRARDQLIPGSAKADATGLVNWLERRVTPSPGAEATVSPLLQKNYQALRDAAETAQANGLGYTVPVQSLRDIKASLDFARTRQIENVTKGDARQFYGLADKAIMATASPAVQQRIANINRFYGGDKRAGEFGLKDRINQVFAKPVLDRAADPNVVAETVNRMATGAPEKFRSLMRGMPSQDADTVRSMIVGNLGQRNGQFTFAQFRRDWEGIPERSKSALFNMAGRAQYRQNLDAIIRNYDRIQQGAKVYANPSGTSGAAAAIAGAGALGGALVSGNIPLAAKIAGLFAGSYLTQRLLTNQRFVKWLANTTTFRPANFQVGLNALIRDEGDAKTKADLVKYRDSLR